MYENAEIIKTFNLFLNAFLTIFESCFPIPTILTKNSSIMVGLPKEYSRRCKNNVYILGRKSNCPILKFVNSQYYNILEKVIRETEKDIMLIQ